MVSKKIVVSSTMTVWDENKRIKILMHFKESLRQGIVIISLLCVGLQNFRFNFALQIWLIASKYGQRESWLLFCLISCWQFKFILHRREYLRSCLTDFVMNTNSVSNICYFLFIHIAFNFIFFRTPETKRRKVVKRRSTPITGNEILAVKQNSEEFEKRALDSKKRIEGTKKKYNLKDRDYNVRTYVWNEEDEKQAKKEREQRKILRQQIRIKYNLPTPKFHRTAAVVSGWRGGWNWECQKERYQRKVATVHVLRSASLRKFLKAIDTV